MNRYYIRSLQDIRNKIVGEGKVARSFLLLADIKKNPSRLLSSSASGKSYPEARKREVIQRLKFLFHLGQMVEYRSLNNSIAGLTRIYRYLLRLLYILRMFNHFLILSHIRINILIPARFRMLRPPVIIFLL